MNYTIKDIAEKAGVSIMTVSRVINNSGYVSMKTRIKVESVLKEMNYQPNLLARSLINRKSHFISIIVPDISNPFYAELTRGVEDITIQEGYDLIISSAHMNKDMELRQIETARSRMADGLILVLPELSETKILEMQNNIPLVVVDKYIKSNDISKIYLKQELGAYRAVQYLLEMGHRKIAFLSGLLNVHNNNVRKMGYIHALEDNRVPFDSSLILNGDFSFESGEKAFKTYMNMKNENRPTAIFSASDLMALGFMRCAYRHKVRIPEDVSIVGFDDIQISSIITPTLTTVRHPYLQMGNAASKLLMSKLGKNVLNSTILSLKNELIIRESVKDIKKI